MELLQVLVFLLFGAFLYAGTDRSLAFPTKDRWEECPLISAYFGCNVTVGNLFHSASHNCSNRPDYSFFLYISLQDRDIELNPVQSVGVNANSSICRVSAVADLRDVAVGRHNLRFLSYNHLDNYTVPKICTDSMDVRDTIGAPSFLNISIKCDGILFKWVGPDLLPGFEVLGYLLEIEETNITNTAVNVTSVLIPYDGLEYNEAYNISLSALYCNGSGNETIGTFFTAMDPDVEGTGNATIWIQNNTYADVTLTTKVGTPGCNVSYPTTIGLNITCQGEKPLLNTMPVSVGADNSIVVESLELTVDRMCLAKLKWENMYVPMPATYTTIKFDTNRLQFCDVLANKDGIYIFCGYADGSNLWGCRAMAVHEETGLNYTSDFNSIFGGGNILNVCAGIYNVTCYGLLRPSRVAISYSGSLYSTVLTVTSGPNCHSSAPPSFTTSSASVTTSSASVTATSSTSNKAHSSDNATIISLVVVVIVLFCIIISIIITGVVIFFVRKKHRRGVLEPETDRRPAVELRSIGVGISPEELPPILQDNPVPITDDDLRSDRVQEEVLSPTASLVEEGVKPLSKPEEESANRKKHLSKEDSVEDASERQDEEPLLGAEANDKFPSTSALQSCNQSSGMTESYQRNLSTPVNSSSYPPTKTTGLLDDSFNEFQGDFSVYQYLSDHQEEKGTSPVERNLHVPSHDTQPPDDTFDPPDSNKAAPLTEYDQDKRNNCLKRKTVPAQQTEPGNSQDHNSYLSQSHPSTS